MLREIVLIQVNELDQILRMLKKYQKIPFDWIHGQSHSGYKDGIYILLKKDSFSVSETVTPSNFG